MIWLACFSRVPRKRCDGVVISQQGTRWNGAGALECTVRRPRRYATEMAHDDDAAERGAAQLSIVGAAVRDLGRLRRVAVIVARHGFGELMMRTSLGNSTK